jgi:hypothetical protein
MSSRLLLAQVTGEDAETLRRDAHAKEAIDKLAANADPAALDQLKAHLWELWAR